MLRWKLKVEYLATFVQALFFNLSHRVLTKTEIKVLGKGLDHKPIQKKKDKRART